MKLSIAPMIDYTNTHFRVFMRMLAPKALLYTEMITPPAIFNNPKKSLFYSQCEKPVAIQLGGSNVEDLVKASIIAEQSGFCEININLGCPSDKVQQGKFGACLMGEFKLVCEIISAIKRQVSISVTAKTRIGIDKLDSYEFFSNFTHSLINAGCDKIIVHARKAWLKGLSPKQNRTIPPINYEYVYKLKAENKNIPIIINGNIKSIDEIVCHLEKVDGVMLGRIAYQNPYLIAKIHNFLYPEIPLISQQEVLELYVQYIEEKRKEGVSLNILTKPLLNIYHGVEGSKNWKTQIQDLLIKYKSNMQKKDGQAFILPAIQGA